MAASAGLSTIALTDHDTTAGLAAARKAAAKHGLRLLNGVELSADTEAGEAHIIGYVIDPDHPALQEMLQRLRDARLERARGIVDKLHALGVPLAWARVEEQSGRSAVGRPHVARALLEEGYVSEVNEAFDRWLANDGPAYVPRFRLSPTEAVTLIREAGGVPTLAHPGVSGNAHLVPELAAAGLGGLEVYYPEHTQADQEQLLALCDRYDLIPTGGTDFHGQSSSHSAPLGSVHVPQETVDRLTG